MNKKQAFKVAAQMINEIESQKSFNQIVEATPIELVKATFQYKIARQQKERPRGNISFTALDYPEASLFIAYQIKRFGVTILDARIIYFDNKTRDDIQIRVKPKEKVRVGIDATLTDFFLDDLDTVYRIIGSGWGSGGDKNPNVGDTVENVFATQETQMADRIFEDAYNNIWANVRNAILKNGSNYLNVIQEDDAKIHYLTITPELVRPPLLNEKAGHNDYFDALEVMVVKGKIQSIETTSVIELAKKRGDFNDIISKLSDINLKDKNAIPSVDTREGLIISLKTSKRITVSLPSEMVDNKFNTYFNKISHNYHLVLNGAFRNDPDYDLSKYVFKGKTFNVSDLKYPTKTIVKGLAISALVLNKPKVDIVLFKGNYYVWGGIGYVWVALQFADKNMYGDLLDYDAYLKDQSKKP